MIGRGRLKRRSQATPPAIDGGRIAADGAQLPFRTLRRLSTFNVVGPGVMSFSPALQRAAVLQRPATIDVVTAGPGKDI